MKKSKAPWWKDGIRFQCQDCGSCCTTHGEYGFVYVSTKEIKKLADLKKLTVPEFKRKYCLKTDGIWHIKNLPESPDCIFLKDNHCLVYKARPLQCRTWPFWPEVLQNKRTWNKEVKNYCTGAGKGRLYTQKEIETILMLMEEWASEI